MNSPLYPSQAPQRAPAQRSLPEPRSAGAPRRTLAAFACGLILTGALLPLAERFAREGPSPWPLERALPDAEQTPEPGSEAGAFEALHGAALSEAAHNCLLAAEAAEGAPGRAWPRLRVERILALLDREEVESQSYGELPAIRAEARWLRSLGGVADLGERSLQDLRFLCGAIHWYLEGLGSLASDPEGDLACHLDRPPSYEAEGLREFAGLSFEDLLGQWD